MRILIAETASSRSTTPTVIKKARKPSHVSQRFSEKVFGKQILSLASAEMNLQSSWLIHAAGAILFLPKPFTVAQLQAMLRMLVSKAGVMG